MRRLLILNMVISYLAFSIQLTSYMILEYDLQATPNYYNKVYYKTKKNIFQDELIVLEEGEEKRYKREINFDNVINIGYRENIEEKIRYLIEVEEINTGLLFERIYTESGREYIRESITRNSKKNMENEYIERKIYSIDYNKINENIKLNIKLEDLKSNYYIINEERLNEYRIYKINFYSKDFNKNIIYIQSKYDKSKNNSFLDKLVVF